MASLNPKSIFQRRWIYLFLGTAITLLLLSWALRGISWATIWVALQTAQWGWLGLGLITFLLSFSVRAWRWGTLLAAYQHPGSFHIRQAAVFIGFAGNAFLPASAGEVLRVTIINRFAKVSLGVAFGSIVAERLLDAAIAVLFLITPLLIHPSSAQRGLGQLPIGWLSIAIIGTCSGFLIAANFPNQIARLAGRLTVMIGLKKLQKRAITVVRSLLGGLSGLRSPKRGITAVLQTFLIWSLTAVTYWTGLIAFGIEAPGFLGAAFLQSIVALAIAIPSSPGYIGPFEAAIRFVLQQYNIPAVIIIAYALTLRLLMFSSLTVVGMIMATQLGLSKSDLAFARTSVNRKSRKPGTEEVRLQTKAPIKS